MIGWRVTYAIVSYYCGSLYNTAPVHRFNHHTSDAEQLLFIPFAGWLTMQITASTVYQSMNCHPYWHWLNRGAVMASGKETQLGRSESWVQIPEKSLGHWWSVQGHPTLTRSWAPPKCLHYFERKPHYSAQEIVMWSMNRATEANIIDKKLASTLNLF